MGNLRVLMVHNFYQQPGGEDESFAEEAALLERHGHPVRRYTRHNDEIETMNPIHLALSSVWSWETRRGLRHAMEDFKPDMVHFQNTFPLVSPAAYEVASSAGVAVVQSLRNYRLLCLNGLLFRDGHVCEDCVGKFVPWPGILHACYRGARGASTVAAGVLTFHRMLDTWRRNVDLFLANTEFSKGKFVGIGFPADRIWVKSNFVAPDPGPGPGGGQYALYAGRLSPEKGLQTLLQAWRTLPHVRLLIVGDGPMRAEVESALRAPGPAVAEFLGSRPHDQVYDLMKGSRFLVVTSEWYETFGRVIIEAYACGVPVIAPRLGAMAEIVEDGKTGLHFAAGDARDLADKVLWAWEHRAEMEAMGSTAREAYLAKYSPEPNYRVLAEAYEQAILRASHGRLAG